MSFHLLSTCLLTLWSNKLYLIQQQMSEDCPIAEKVCARVSVCVCFVIILNVKADEKPVRCSCKGNWIFCEQSLYLKQIDGHTGRGRGGWSAVCVWNNIADEILWMFELWIFSNGDLWIYCHYNNLYSGVKRVLDARMLRRRAHGKPSSSSTAL